MSSIPRMFSTIEFGNPADPDYIRQYVEMEAVIQIYYKEVPPIDELPEGEPIIFQPDASQFSIVFNG